MAAKRKPKRERDRERPYSASHRPKRNRRNDDEQSLGSAAAAEDKPKMNVIRATSEILDESGAQFIRDQGLIEELRSAVELLVPSDEGTLWLASVFDFIRSLESVLNRQIADPADHYSFTLHKEFFSHYFLLTEDMNELVDRRIRLFRQSLNHSRIRVDVVSDLAVALEDILQTSHDSRWESR